MAKKTNPPAQAAGRLGGLARAKALTVRQMSVVMTKAAHARAKKLSAKRRSEIAKTAVLARIRKYGQKRRLIE